MPEFQQEQGIRLLPYDPLAAEVTAFLIDRQARGLSPGTIAYYRKKLTLWRKVFVALEVNDWQHLTPQHIRRGLLQLARTHNPGGVHAAFRALRAFLAWWEGETEPQGWRNPIGKVKPPKLTANPLPPVRVDTLKAMLATCDKTLLGQRDRAIILALFDTGCRASEFVALDIGDFDMATGAVIVRHGKGDKRRVTFLGNKTRREVGRYLRGRGNPDAGALWVTDEGGRLTVSGLRHVIRRRAKRAGVAAPGLHSFRRAFALAMKRGGADLVDLQKLMGHADLSVLRRYLATDESDLAAAHKKAGPVDRLL